MKNKRGTHVGIVLSFAIFVLFLVFLYSVTEPTINIQKDKQFLLDYLEEELIQKSSENLTSITLMINKTIQPNRDCVKVQNIIGEVTNVTELIIKDEYNKVFNYEIEGQSLTIGTGLSFSGFLKFYYSDELGSSLCLEDEEGCDFGGCDPITASDYTIGLTKKDSHVFETTVIDLVQRYNTDYDNLKDELKIPVGTDFGFGFTFNNGTIIKTQDKKALTSIYSKEVPIQYVDGEANVDFGFINVRVW